MTDKLRVEGSTENLPDRPERTFGINGLQDVPRSIIPVPFYKLVQPNSTSVFLPDGKRAPDGVFLMCDVRKTVDELEFLILRAKRQTREQKNDTGYLEKVVSLNVLGLNLVNKKPFILSVPITSFSAFGQIFEQLEEQGAVNAWDFSVEATTFEKNEEKTVGGLPKPVNYWVVELELLGQPDAETAKLAQDYYDDFAVKLDRNDDEDDLEAIAGK
jgi:hypothetical protein